MKNKITKVIKDYTEGFLSLIYPQFCVICGNELNQQNDHFCFMCEQDLHYTYFEKYKDYTLADEVFWGRLNIESVYALLYYENGNSTKNILHQIKYKEGRSLGVLMGEMMGKKMKNMEEFKDIDALIPIPIHSKKSFIRGYNQSLLIAEGMSEVMEIPVLDALYRKTHDESQTKKSKEERLENVKGKFALKEGGLKNCNHVLIVDDVLTTGSTLEYAARAIYEKKVKAKVSLGTIALAH
ncbi:ComF family protein [Brumimicrobium salinarum]|uniref:ComF family protein n=1 Tax=Brumimicrobium salinarum TaxID=2058658 RepID=A0A2I0QZI6_9FLAO|nr:phosphoribosyltransferase family protein [Brumimicrobium salinarum]PKR79728.1 ComF family protein [Brumimicrobium salinarum]